MLGLPSSGSGAGASVGGGASSSAAFMNMVQPRVLGLRARGPASPPTLGAGIVAPAGALLRLGAMTVAPGAERGGLVRLGSDGGCTPPADASSVRNCLSIIGRMRGSLPSARVSPCSRSAGGSVST